MVKGLSKFKSGDRVSYEDTGIDVLGTVIIFTLIGKFLDEYSYVVEWDDGYNRIHHENDLKLVNENIMNVNKLFEGISI